MACHNKERGEAAFSTIQSSALSTILSSTGGSNVLLEASDFFCQRDKVICFQIFIQECSCSCAGYNKENRRYQFKPRQTVAGYYSTTRPLVFVFLQWVKPQIITLFSV